MERIEVEVFKSEDAFLINTNRFAFRPNESAKIVGAKWVTPEAMMPVRLCWEIMYEDEFVDYVSVSDSKNYRIVGGKIEK